MQEPDPFRETFGHRACMPITPGADRSGSAPSGPQACESKQRRTTACVSVRLGIYLSERVARRGMEDADIAVDWRKLDKLHPWLRLVLVA